MVGEHGRLTLVATSGWGASGRRAGTASSSRRCLHGPDSRHGSPTDEPQRETTDRGREKPPKDKPDCELPENAPENLDEKLDHALEETFPTSDPVSVNITK
jgi:hypothetical protein